MRTITAICVLGVASTLVVGCESERYKEECVRFAQFNIWELSRAKLDQVDAVGHGISPQLKKAAEIVQRVHPDVLLINEIDYDAAERLNLQLFVDEPEPASDHRMIWVDVRVR